ncbi:deoxyribose-phosphate aldolase [Microvirga arsenatis]|uniref:Deoxyribose-phosphate aldolase n=1 Tax=Microvirga arsenatis TaxID=2692265 RepID=A0ABW9Z365_9HYPH|nr:deoxyribose-phosphate aldolase [Microvirga arsenatis]NBJ11758.1 deoxyribose-phosphate aldolase [Microvirga arsenatis]NBJ25039.1 deoxyribose-phosphate aldolase [Microvirga arsenatis]
MSDAQIAVRALRSLDLTDLTDTCTDQAIDALCKKALDPRGPVAAVCVWPQFVKRAQENLKGSTVRIATVVNFPAGGEDVSRVSDDTQEALSDGANEIDLVIPYEAVRRGDLGAAAEMVEAVRELVDGDRLLKVILETGELKDPKLIEAASLVAIEAGADFIKTSTGKTPVSATPEAAEIMLRAIRASGRPVGLKPSGGIRTVADAGVYLNLADQIMGPGWATPKTFRIGASSVYDALIAAIEGREGTTVSGAY